MGYVDNQQALAETPSAPQGDNNPYGAFLNSLQ
jgi:hypothetical protein